MKNLTFLPSVARLVMCIFFYTAIAGASYGQKKKQPPVKAKPDPNAAYGNASYKGIQPGQFLKTWLIAGPLLLRNDTISTPDQPSQQAFFNEDVISQVVPVAGKPMPPVVYKGKSLEWKPYTSATDILDLDAIYTKADYAAAYALAEIKTDSAVTAYLGLGSDDGVKVWLNGKLIHTNWIGR
ncbi:MAG TPA: hypothetical protein VIN08_09895, partial [Ohtaekwangia sp.]|uniref:hypothetical protein n=1 Tax=Ohtaekwangia sp. TaxID=2066019 RepID=UPI002F923AE2